MQSFSICLNVLHGILSIIYTYLGLFVSFPFPYLNPDLVLGGRSSSFSTLLVLNPILPSQAQPNTVI